MLGRDHKDLAGKVVVKIGFSNDPARRCEEHNSALPPAGSLKWKLTFRSKAFPDGGKAKLAEDDLKARFDTAFESLGGEFFLGDPRKMLTAFMAMPGIANIVRSTVMSRKKL